MRIPIGNCVIMAILVFGGSHAAAQEEKLKEIRGTIRQIDLKTGSLVLQLMSTDKQMPFNLAAKDLPVTNPLGAKLMMADLRPELRLAVQVRNEDEIVSVRVDGPYQNGMVKSVDPAKRMIHYKDVYGDRSLAVPVDAKIIVAGRDGALDDFRPGAPIQVLRSLDQKSVLQIQTGKGINIRDPYLRITRYQGMLAEVDQAKRSVQVVVQDTDSGIVRNYEVSPDAYLRLIYHFKPVEEVGFDQLARWVKVHYFVDRDTGKIVNIDADLPVMTRRKVLKLEPKSDRITVEDELKEKTLVLSPQVKVLTPRGDGKLADIGESRIVNCALSLDRSRVLVLYLWDR